MSLANPFGPPVRGSAQAAATMDRAASNFRDGRSTGFDRVAECTTADLAYIVEVEHYEAKVGGSEAVTPVVPSHDRPTSPGRGLEDRASSRGSNHVRPAGGIGHPSVDARPDMADVSTPSEIVEGRRPGCRALMCAMGRWSEGEYEVLFRNHPPKIPKCPQPGHRPFVSLLPS